MAIPVIDRDRLEVPGDLLPRPNTNCYWLIGGAVLAGEHPGSMFHGATLARVDALLDAGVRRFIDLTDEPEGPGPYVAILREQARARGLQVGHERFAIPDFNVPSIPLMREALDAVYRALDAGLPAYVHCWGGVGRTGTVVGCLLREQGMSGAEAVELIARKWLVMEKRERHPRSPETSGQVAFIEGWKPF